MSEVITAEMDELEKMKRKFSYLAKLQDIKIQRIKLKQNLAKLDEEETKLEQHLKEIEES